MSPATLYSETEGDPLALRGCAACSGGVGVFVRNELGSSPGKYDLSFTGVDDITVSTPSSWEVDASYRGGELLRVEPLGLSCNTLVHPAYSVFLRILKRASLCLRLIAICWEELARPPTG